MLKKLNNLKNETNANKSSLNPSFKSKIMKYYPLKLLFITFFILGCNPPTINDKSIIQKINSLDMDIYSDEGSKIYSINEKC